MYWTENIMLIMMMFKNNNPNHLDYVGEIIHQDRQSLRKQCCHHWTNWIALLWPNYYLPFRFKWNLIITILMTLLKKHLLLILLFSRFASFQWMGNICFEEREKYTLPERPLINVDAVKIVLQMSLLPKCAPPGINATGFVGGNVYSGYGASLNNQSNMH